MVWGRCCVTSKLKTHMPEQQFNTRPARDLTKSQVGAQSPVQTPLPSEESGSPTEVPREPARPVQKRRNVYCCVRIDNYRLKALAPCDPEDPQGDQEFREIGGDTTVSLDREAVFQLGRDHGGLLMEIGGLPSAGAMKGFERAVERVRGEAA